MNKLLPAAMLIVAASPSGFAARTEGANIRLSTPILVNSVEVPAGDYRITWSGLGSDIQVRFLHDAKVVVTARANVIDAHNEATIGRQENPFQLVTTQRNDSTLLKEIQLPKEALIFLDSQMTDQAK